jgi:hypothetical protein
MYQDLSAGRAKWLVLHCNQKRQTVAPKERVLDPFKNHVANSVSVQDCGKSSSHKYNGKFSLTVQRPATKLSRIASVCFLKLDYIVSSWKNSSRALEHSLPSMTNKRTIQACYNCSTSGLCAAAKNTAGLAIVYRLDQDGIAVVMVHNKHIFIAKT